MNDPTDPSDRPSPWLDRLAAETVPTASEVGRLRRDLADRATDARVSRALLRTLAAPSTEELALVRRRITAPRRTWWWTALPAIVLGGGGLVAAAAVTLIVGAAWLTRPAPVDQDRAVAITLEPSPEPRPVGDAVRLSPNGTGTVSGTERSPTIVWTSGTIGVDVDPGRGIGLTVSTREAEVRVIGTVFEVTRDALGTTVDVTRGTVAVTCAAGADHVLEADQRTTCLPTTAPGLLGRANELKRAGAPWADVLATVEAALPQATGPFLGELVAVQAEALGALGRHGEARAAADRYLGLGGPRVVDLLRIGANAALAERGCDAALPYLERLEERGEGDPELLARCEAGR